LRPVLSAHTGQGIGFVFPSTTDIRFPKRNIDGGNSLRG
jgi:hypothetical protein